MIKAIKIKANIRRIKIIQIQIKVKTIQLKANIVKVKVKIITIKKHDKKHQSQNYSDRSQNN